MIVFCYSNAEDNCVEVGERCKTDVEGSEEPETGKRVVTRRNAKTEERVESTAHRSDDNKHGI